ncbi:MAG: fibronectin type III domain-containing protein [Deltaproteobacteria bacterium]|nr:fibronectin type III domain-containing protein [Deltaproteobacteria bacterium]
MSVGEIDSVQIVTTAGKAGLASPTGFVSVTPGLAIPVTLDTGAPNTADGVRSFDVTWRDAADNTVAGGTYTITLDRAGPTGGALTINGHMADATTSTTSTASTAVTLSFGSVTDLSGVAQVELSNDDNAFSTATFQTFTDPLLWTLPASDGAHTVFAKFRDLAGNVSASAISNSIAVRMTAPSGGSLVIAGGAISTATSTPSTIPLAIDAQNAAEMAIFVNGTAVTSGNGPWVTFANSANIALPSGDGNKNVLVRFRNAARVEGGSVSGNITLDTLAPQAASITIFGTLGDGTPSAVSSTVSPTGTGAPSTFTASANVVVGVAPPQDDVTQMAFALTSPGTLCTAAGTFAGAIFTTFSGNSTQILTGGDGPKRLCVLLKDRAGNTLVSKAIGADIMLDQTPPSNPSFVDIESGVTSSVLLPPSGTATITQVTDNLGGPVTYQCLGGNPGQVGWWPCSVNTSTSQLTAPFQLTTNSVNTIGIRALDTAHNPSAGSFISVRHDSVPPNVPVITDVDGDKGVITITWDAPAATGFVGDTVVGYRVNYGLAPGDTKGTGAAQGSSPIDVGDVTSVTLTNVQPKTPYYVSVEALDAAGNSSGPTGEVVVLPNQLNPRVLSTFAGDLRAMSAVLPEINSLNGGTIVDTSNFFVANSQGLMRMSVNVVDTGSPAVLGRVYVPDVVPDVGQHVAAVLCTNQGVGGYCVMPVGTTAQGNYTNDALAERAGAPVVFFPHTSSIFTSAPGKVLTVLPVRPFSAVAGPFGVANTLPTVFTAAANGIEAFDLTTPRQPTLLAVQNNILFTNVSDMGIIGNSTLAVWGQRQGEGFKALFLYPITSVLTHTIGAGVEYIVKDKAGNFLPSDAVPSFTSGGIYFFHGDTNTSSKCDVSSYSVGNATAVQTATLDDYATYGLGNCTYNVTAAGNGRIWAFFGPQSGEIQTGPYIVGLRVSGTTLDTSNVLKTTRPTPYDGQGSAMAAGRIGNTITNVDAILGGGDSRSALARWSATNPLSGSSTLASNTANRFLEVPSASYAEKDNAIFVPSATTTTIYTIDISNPLNPNAVFTSSPSGNTRTSGAYSKLVVHGQYLFALLNFATFPATQKGIDVYRIASAVGSPSNLVYMGTSGSTISSHFLNDLAFAGKWAIASIDNSGDLMAIDVTNKTSPSGWTAVGTTATFENVYALSARTGTELVSAVDTTFPALVYGVQRPATSDKPALIRTYRFNGTTFTNVSSTVELPVYNVASVRLEGDQMLVGGYDASALATVTTTASPSVAAGTLPVAGPVFSQGGYLSGLGASLEPNGPNFTVLNNGGTDGYLIYSGCTVNNNGFGTFTHRAGEYTASCGQSGIAILTPTSPKHPSLFFRNDLSGTWPQGSQAGAALVTDGLITAIGGASQVSTESVYSASQATNISGSPVIPAHRFDLAVTSTTPRFMNLADHVVWITTSDNAFGNALYGYEWDNMNTGGSKLRGSWTWGVSQTSAVNIQPVGDEDYLFFAQATQTTTTDSDTLQVIDIRNPDSLTQPLGKTRALATKGVHANAMALYRQRLYVGLNSNVIEVYDVSTIAATSTFPALTSITLPTSVKAVTGLTVIGNNLFFTSSGSNTGLIPAGWGMVRLGSTFRDGSGATVVLSDESYTQPLREPTVVGDTLYMVVNQGLGTWDLTPLWSSTTSTPGKSELPTLVSRATTQDATRTDPVHLVVDGPFAYLVGGTYRIYDLR